MSAESRAGVGGSARSLAALVGVVLIAMTGFGVFLPIFPFLALELGASPTSATIAMGAYSFGQLISAPFWGRLSDRVGRRPILILGLLGGVASYLWIATAHSALELGAARLFGGLMAGNVGAAFAAAADISNDKTRARNMGLLGAGVGVGFVAGPALGGVLVGQAPSLADFALVCYVSAALAGLAACAAYVFFQETRARGETAAGPSTQQRSRPLALLRSRPALLRFCAVMLIAVTAQAMMETTFGLLADARLAWGPRGVGWTLAGLGAAAIVLQGGLAGRAARVWGEALTLAIGLCLFAAGLGGLAVVETWAGMAVALTAFAIGLGLSTPALSALIAAQAPADERGAVMGLSQSAGALGRVVGPLAAGPAFEHLSPAAPFTIGAILVLGALLVGRE